MLLLRVHVGVHIVIQLQILAKVIGFIKSNWIKSLLFNNFTISYLVGVHSSEEFWYTLLCTGFLHRLRIRMLHTSAAWQTLMASYDGLSRVVSPWSERSRSITLRLVYLLTKTTMYMFWWVLYSFMVWEFSMETYTCTCIIKERFHLSLMSSNKCLFCYVFRNWLRKDCHFWSCFITQMTKRSPRDSPL